MRSVLHLVLISLCFASAAQAQRVPDLAPAEPVPADFAGAQWQDSRGCLFARATVAGAVTWLPLLDGERRPVCTEPVVTGAPALPAPPDSATAPPLPAVEPTEPRTTEIETAEATDEAADGAEVPPQVAEAAEVLARVARIAAGQGRAATAAATPDPDTPPPAFAATPGQDPFAELSRMAEETGGPAGRLIFVPPDDRVRIVHVDLPSVLVGGGDPFGMNAAMPAVVRHGAHPVATVGYHPAPIRLAVAPPIPGFGPDPAPVVRVRRAARPADTGWVSDGP